MATIKKIQLNGIVYDIKSSEFDDNDILTIDLEDTNFGEPNPVNADTLNGKLASDYVLKDELNLSEYIRKDEIYPIGGIYISLNSTNPSIIFGGVWEQIQGKFLLGASETYPVNQTGGEETHTLTTDEMPNHTHGVTQGYVTEGGTGGYARVAYSGSSGLIGPSGGSQPHNNMPPYLAVYIWKRIS